VVRRAAWLAAAAVGSLTLAACSNILGLKDLEGYPDDGGPDASADGAATGESGSDDVTSSDSPTSDSPTGDAPASDGPAGDGPVGDGAKPGDGSPEGAAEGGADASCTDTSADPHNCGACGHDCLGGTCSGGQCSPVVLANVPAVDIVVVGSTVYWVDGLTTNGNLWQCDVSNCAATAIASGQANPNRLAYDGVETLFWTVRGSGTTSDGSVWAYDVVKKTPPTKIATAIAAPEGIAADATYVYWAQDFSSQNQIVQYARATSTATAIATGASSAPYSVALGSGELYVAETGSGNIVQCAEGSVSPTVFQQNQGIPLAVWVDPTWVYWTDFQNAGAVFRANIATGTPQQLPGTQANPIRVVSDGNGVYWTNNGTTASDGSLVGCAQPSCSTSTPLLGSLQRPVGLAIDAAAVYFGTTGDNRLRKLAR
jgi:hypothetical protein